MTDQPLIFSRYAPPVRTPGAVSMSLRKATRASDARADPAPMRWAVIIIAIAFLTLFVLVPLLNVFAQAFSKGLQPILRPSATRTRSPRSN